MATVTLRGNPVTLGGNEVKPQPGRAGLHRHRQRAPARLAEVRRRAARS
mgnify:CR=1 FL=1